MLRDVGFVAGNTSRTRAYLAALERHQLLPSWTLLLDDESNEPKIGQAEEGVVQSDDDLKFGDSWSEVGFDPTAPLQPWLEKLEIDYVFSNSRDIHSDKVVDLIAKASPSVLIYSGYGGVFLRKRILECGKLFLHIHGGYLPDFKGSTTNYYSLIEDNSLGASAIFLTSEIDSGPVLSRRKFDPPPNCSQIDHVYDAAARARVLIDTLLDFQKQGTWNCIPQANEEGNLFYIIHPVLKHLAILTGDGSLN